MFIPINKCNNLVFGISDNFIKEALNQIDKKRYDSEMTELGVTNILKLGIAFSGKNIKIKTM